MVKQEAAPLDRTFAALADPTRRALLARLELEDAVTVSDLARPFPMSLPAVMKHLDVLHDAGLITRQKTGRTVACRLNAGPMEEAMHWLSHYQRFWAASLDRLAALVEEEALVEKKECPPSPPPNRPSPSSAASRRRRPASTPPGPTRKS